MKQLRPYQTEAVEAIFRYWGQGGGNPLVELATGTGKSLVIAKVVRAVVETYPNMRVLMLVHVRELVKQNEAELREEWPQAPVGINSAGLGRRDRYQKVLFASVQSVYRQARALGPRDLILIDEAHMIPASSEGMYRTLIEGLREMVPDLRIAGFTATPYRLGSGRIDRGDGRLFDQIVYSYDVGRGVEDGYLVPLVARSTSTKISVEGVGRRGGEFIESELAAVANREDTVRQAIAEIVSLGADRRSWIVFCVDVAHAMRVTRELQVQGVVGDVVTGEMDKGARASVIARFKAGQIRCLVSVNVLSVGFNAPRVDLIALLRPTLSTGLYVQQLGRGTRCVGQDIAESVANGKSDCLVLDFAQNVRRHGPVDAIAIEPRERSPVSSGTSGMAKPDGVMAKECPACARIVALDVYACPTIDCGFEWPRPKPMHEAKPDLDAVIMARNAPTPTFRTVADVRLNQHFKEGKPTSLRVTYVSGINTFSEWVCFEHDGYARRKAEQWWRAMDGAEPPPGTVADAIFRQDELGQVIGVAVREDGAYWRVTAYRLRRHGGDVIMIDGNLRSRPDPAPPPPSGSAPVIDHEEIPL